MESEAHRKASLRYRKANTHQLNVTFYPKDEPLWEWLKDKPKAQTVKDLIRREMER